MKPVLLVIAGPNGAGKTTVTVRLREERWSEGVEYLNPDEVARDRFGDWNSPEAVLAAARWTEARREELLAAGGGIAFETVLSTHGKLDFVARARDRSYLVRAFFVGTTDPRINAGRVAGRVMGGGHSVPIEKIVSRYARSLGNLPAIIRLSDRVYVYDNSVDGAEATLCFRTEDGLLRKVYGRFPSGRRSSRTSWSGPRASWTSGRPEGGLAERPSLPRLVRLVSPGESLQQWEYKECAVGELRPRLGFS